MILNCLALLFVGYIIYKLLRNEPIPYLNSDQLYDQGFRVSAWDGRDINYKNCLNNIKGERNYIYQKHANKCNINDTFNNYF